MRHEDINVNDEVLYIPHHLLMGPKQQMEKYENLGRVTSKNDIYIFVLYVGKGSSQATRAEDLYTIRNRPDLQEALRHYETERDKTTLS